ncbi:MAG TPA: hypothetical protein VFE46_14980 [Pirellulales bacterium]|jgi:REP element-mobilizing transposase RayT|nr:hypothetical protein [Pirellulales bacterium]
MGIATAFVTATSYGTWLPGDLRGYVEDSVILPASPRLLEFAQAQLRHEPVLFTPNQQTQLFVALANACKEFDYRLSDASVETWHLHWIVDHDGNVSEMVGRLKNRMRQALDQGRIWTAGYWDRTLTNETALRQAQKYIAKHSGCRMSGGKSLS